MPLTPEIRTFLQEVLDTPLKQELLVFFATNQGMDTVRGLSVWLGRPAAEVKAAAEALVQKGLLRRQGDDEQAVYSYHPAPELVGLVEAFLQLYQSARAQLLRELEQARQQAQSAWEQLRVLQWEQSRFRLVLSSMTESVIVLLPDSSISYLNEACARWLGDQPAKLVGKSLSEIEAPLAPLLLQGMAEIIRPPHPAIIREWSLPDGIIFRANLMPVFNEQKQFVGVVGILMDVTPIRRREREQQEMLTVLAHDLKSPLTAIRGFALSGLKGFLGQLPPSAQRAFQIIAEQSDRIHTMVQQMVQVMTDVHGIPTLHPIRFDLRECAQSIASVYEGQCAERNLTLSVVVNEQPVWVHADRELMERVIANLLSNAIKYNRQGGKVEVRVYRTDSRAVVEVEDTGVGIPPSELPFIFRRFYRASTATGEGSGVGLSFVRQVVEAHGGHVEANSSVGQGSLFRIALPLAAEPVRIRSSGKI